MILFVLQRGHVSQRYVEIFAHFQPMFGKKMEENAVVVLVSGDAKTSTRPNKVTNEKPGKGSPSKWKESVMIFKKSEAKQRVASIRFWLNAFAMVIFKSVQ